MRNCLTMVILFLSIATVYATDQKQSVTIDYIHSGAIVVDEWKSPGLYSPVNIFDGDINTIYAQSSCRSFRYVSNGINFKLRFNKSVKIDEIRIMNGFCKNKDLFNKNNRIKNLRLEFYMDDNQYIEEKPEVENVDLQDRMEFQSFKFAKEHNLKRLEFNTQKIFNGSKYDDTCMTELEFYYQGRKIEISGIEKLKKDYIKKVGTGIMEAFSDKTYVFDIDTWNDTVELFKDGRIKYHQSESYSNPPAKEIMPDSWKVEDSRLFMRISGVWILYNYAIIESFAQDKTVWNIVLFTNPYEFVQNDHPYKKIYYKRLPDDYRFEMFTP